MRSKLELRAIQVQVIIIIQVQVIIIIQVQVIIITATIIVVLLSPASRVGQDG